MRSVLWTSITICVTFIVFMTVLTAGLVCYFQYLDNESDSFGNSGPEDGIFSLLGLSTTKRVNSSRSKHMNGEKLDFIQLAVNYGAPILGDISVIQNSSFVKFAPLERLNFSQMVEQIKYPCVEYEVKTQDGYLLTIFRVQDSKGLPILLVHGFLDSADTFILRGARSLVGALAVAGYDVWVANLRGNRYSRRHATLNPDVDKSFWQFSFHEQGQYDLPAIIDFILNQTGEPRLKAISHSQGSTTFFVMGSTLPEYNDKIEMYIALGPICHLKNLQPPLSSLMLYDTLFNILLQGMGKDEIFGDISQLMPVVKKLCSFGFIGNELCLEGGLFYIFGRDAHEVKADFVPVITSHYPTGTSLKNLNHLMQLRYTFSQYDYGFISNILQYSSLQPPLYDLSKVSMKTAFFVAKNDIISSWNDTQLLKKELPNIVEFRVVNRRKFNHIDYVWGEYVNSYLYPQIIEVLQKYNTVL